MSKFFYLKLALNNLKRNKETYIPYIIAGIGMVFTFLMLNAMMNNEDIRNMRNGDVLHTILSLGLVVVGIFSVIFIIYANNFLLKRRKKELGLYAILGLEKKHVMRVLFYEAIFVYFISFIGGMIISFVFGKLSFLVLLKMIKISEGLTFSIDYTSIITALGVFGGIYLITFILNVIQVKIANPIQLLKGEAEGEKVPKTSWILTILGFLSLGGGYYISITVKNPLAAIPLFFIAVLLVIMGTYALFTAGSIAILKMLQKKKKFYYRINNFISVSGMIYRMKQNAAGLANICILSTMVLVMVSGTLALFLGMEDSLRYRFPMDIEVSGYDSFDQQGFDALVKKEARKFGLDVINNMYFKSMDSLVQIKGSEGKDFYFTMNSSNYDQLYDFKILTVGDYNRIFKEDIELKENEILISQEPRRYGKDTISLHGDEYQIKKEIDEVFFTGNSGNFEKGITIIAKDEQTIEHIWNLLFPEEGQFKYYNYYTTDGDIDQKLVFAQEINRIVKEQYGISRITSLEMTRQEWYSTYGGLLYLGSFLGIVFMMATVLIIYFKQISEGMVDRNRFIIMQKVGMSNEEVKVTIRKQILMVFFLPLLTAILHVAFAFPMLKRILLMFGLTNALHIFLCIVGCVAVFIVFYMIIYSKTAKVYYKLVQR